MERPGNAEKVLFVQKINDEFVTEGIWCIKNGNNYIVDNIPFIARRVSLGDTIKAEYDEYDKALYFDDFVQVSGNTTVRLYFDDENTIEDVRRKLNELECEGEIFLASKILAVNVPYNIDYNPIKKLLNEGEQQGKWTYEESCLAHDPNA